MTAEGGLRQTLLEIVKAETMGDYDKTLKAANKCLKKFPKETYAFKCKLVSLIQLSQFDEALVLIKKTPPGQMGKCHYEKAYIHYRLGDNDSALSELEKCDKSDTRAVELKAQLFYRLDRFEEAHELYNFLLKNHSDENDEERKANLLAVRVQLAARGQFLEDKVDLDTFEQVYNDACYSIEKKDYQKALIGLEKAIKMCHESLTDGGLPEEEIEEEAASLSVQRGFCLHAMGRIAEALPIYKSILAIGPSDVSLVASLLNNIAAATKNTVEARKRIKAATQLEFGKMSRRQRLTLQYNQVLILLSSNQREPARRALETLLKEYGSSEQTEMLEAALLWRSGEAEKALAVLASSSIATIITRLHILVNLGRLDAAVSEVNNLPIELQSRAAVFSLQVSLLLALQQKEKALDLLEQSMSRWKKEEVKAAVLALLADIQVKEEKHAEAVLYLEQLTKLRPDDLKVTLSLLREYAFFNPGKAEELRDKCLIGEEKEVNVNVDELEDSDWILYGEKYKQKKEQKGGEMEDTDIVTGKLRKRKRKRRILPKNFDANVPVDPERWLPKQERTAAKKKNKRNKERDIGKGTQGSTAAGGVEYKSTVESSPRAPATPAEGPRQQRPGQAQKKKKGKGNKW